MTPAAKEFSDAIEAFSLAANGKDKHTAARRLITAYIRQHDATSHVDEIQEAYRILTSLCAAQLLLPVSLRETHEEGIRWARVHLAQTIYDQEIHPELSDWVATKQAIAGLVPANRSAR